MQAATEHSNMVDRITSLTTEKIKEVLYLAMQEGSDDADTVCNIALYVLESRMEYDEYVAFCDGLV